MIRLTVHFSGHVQGVGFRYTTRNLALGYSVAGYVQNLDDGRVLLVVEGAESDVRAYVSAVSAAMEQYVHDKTIASSPATGEFGAPGLGRLRVRH